jgi:SAM-dependent methyltransferase
VIYCFDIDGVVCTNTWGEYEQAEPFRDTIQRINSLHAEGHRIVLATARGTTTGIDWRPVTELQLAEWGVAYDELHFGKPQADVYVDDRGLSLDEWRRGTEASRARLLADAAYLDLTYSEERAPRGSYPSLLAAHLHDRVLGRAGRLLDLGCGRGEHLEAFARLGHEVVGIDISERAKELAAPFPVHVADLERDPLPVEPGVFDFAFSKSVVEHMREPVALLAAAHDALRPGGVAVVMTPSWEHTHWGPFYVDHTHVTPFTAPGLADALSLAGFAQVRVDHFRQLPVLWRRPWLRPAVGALARLPVSYRPYRQASWPDGVNKLIRFSKEVMLLAVARKGDRA